MTATYDLTTFDRLGSTAAQWPLAQGISGSGTYTRPINEIYVVTVAATKRRETVGDLATASPEQSLVNPGEASRSYAYA